MKRVMHTRADLDKIFFARSMAVVGASSSPGKLGYVIVDTILKGGYEGQLYPVNPKGGKILGMPVFPNLSSLPEAVDTMIVAVSASFIPEILREAGQKGIRSAVILSAGFAESEHPDLEQAIIQIASEYQIHFLGPNIQGVYCPANKLSAAFFPALTLAGPIAVIAQSGSVTAYLAEQFERDGIGIRAGVNLGNKTNIDECDLLEYFAEDKETRAVALYLEGVKDGRHFLEVVEKVILRKPVSIMKSGRTAIGQRSAASHTGAMASNDAVFDAVCKQRSLFRVFSMESLMDAAKGQALIRPPRGNRLMIVSSSGGGNTLAVDEAVMHGLKLPSLPREFVEKVKREVHIAFNASVSNPCDLAFFEGSQFRDVIRIAEEFDIADIYLLNYGDPITHGVESVKELAQSIQSSLAVAYFGGGNMELEGTRILNACGIPTFATPERAITGIAAAVHYADFRKQNGGDNDG